MICVVFGLSNRTGKSTAHLTLYGTLSSWEAWAHLCVTRPTLPQALNAMEQLDMSVEPHFNLGTVTVTVTVCLSLIHSASIATD